MNFLMTINGAAVEASAQFPVINPATETELAQCPIANEIQMDSAIQAARKAFTEWSKTSIEKRREILHQCSEKIKEKKDVLALLLSQEQGKPLARAEEEIDDSVDLLQQVAKISVPNVILQDDSDSRVEVLHKPLGVVLSITPWNYPIYIAVNNLAMTLFAGSTIVLKPSPYTPLSTLLLGEILRETIPAGVLNVVSGGDSVGAYLTKHPGIDKINFTGSVEVGKKIAQIAAKNLKPVTLELGGNDPAIVLADVDVKKIAEPIFWGAFTNTGQICIAIKRLYVHESVLEPLVNELKAIAESIKLGEGTEQGVQMGPLNNAAQLKKIKALVADAKRNGGKIITGGKSLRRPGYFYPPTLITGVKEGIKIVDEEQFGPVLPIISYHDIEEVLTRANQTRWGLGASVWTNDWRKGVVLAQRMESGTAWVNQVFSTHPHAPFGGVKDSGIGREGGIWGFSGSSELQTLSVAKK